MTYRDGRRVGTASGFFYRNGDNLFLVTNKHVFANREQPDTARIRLHTDPKNLGQNADVRLPLCSSAAPAWRTPKEVADVDVAAFPLEADFRTKYVINPISRESLPPSDVRLQAGQDVLVLGYPLGWADEHNNLPIVRRGILASAYGTPFGGKPVCLIDARLHRGTSGSAVITKPTSSVHMANGTTKIIGDGAFWCLLGVLSAALKPRDEAEIAEVADSGPLDLNLCWYSQIVEELTSSPKRSVNRRSSHGSKECGTAAPGCDRASEA